MSLKLFITNGTKTEDITELAQAITWSGDYLQCARTLNIELISSYTDKNIPSIACELGSIMTLTLDNRILFDGFVFERQKSTESNIINIICYDRGIYLKRNEATYKFSGTAPETIAKRVCADFGISTGSVASTGVKISRNFVGAKLYQVIQTAYTLASEQTGKQYIIRFSGKKLNVIEKKVTEETLVIEGGKNLMSASTSESITNMINQVVIYNSKGVLVKTLKNQADINAYGLMQSYLKQPDKKDVTSKAKKILSDNGASQKIVVNNLGNITNLTGGTVIMREPYTGICGLFYIDSDIHTWKLGQYYNKLGINFKNIMDEQEAGTTPGKSGVSGTWEYLYKPGGVKNENG